MGKYEFKKRVSAEFFPVLLDANCFLNVAVGSDIS